MKIKIHPKTKKAYIIGAIAVIVVLLFIAFFLSPKKDTQTDSENSYTLSVHITYPKTETYSDSILATGEIAAWETAIISSEINGLQVQKIAADVGDTVKSGQVLATLEDSFVRFEFDTLKSQKNEADIAWQEAKKNAKRARALLASKAMSEQEISLYLTDEKKAAEKFKATKAQFDTQNLRLKRTQITAPDNGVILSKTISQGEVVAAGQELFRLVRQGKIEWHAQVKSHDLAKIKPMGLVKIRTSNGSEYQGSVKSITPGVASNTRDATVYVELTDMLQDDLFPGMFAQGEFILDKHQGHSVPEAALVIRDGKSYVFSVDAKHIVHKIPVHVIRYLPQRIVLSGITDKDQIITRGGEFLDDGDVVNISQDDIIKKARKTKKTETKPHV